MLSELVFVIVQVKPISSIFVCSCQVNANRGNRINLLNQTTFVYLKYGLINYLCTTFFETKNRIK